MKILVVLLAIAVASFGRSSAAITVYISPPRIESAEASGLTPFGVVSIATEKFEPSATLAAGAFPGSAGYTSTGIHTTYTAGGGNATGSGSSIFENNKYAGLNQGNFLGVLGNSSLNLTLDKTAYTNGAQYFGLYITAVDQYNSINLYSKGSLISIFSARSILSLISSGAVVTSIDGTTYNPIDYYGKPGTNLNKGEAYVYLHFVATDGTTFDSIVLNQGNSTAVLENDNHSILETAPALPGTLVSLPEPSAIALGLLGIIPFLRRKR